MWWVEYCYRSSFVLLHIDKRTISLTLFFPSSFSNKVVDVDPFFNPDYLTWAFSYLWKDKQLFLLFVQNLGLSKTKCEVNTTL